MSIPESHLAQEAIAALVDGELPAGPARRAAAHLTGCATCRMAVQAQREAKEALLRSQEVAVPGDLLSRLQAIPFTAEVPGGGGGTLAAGPEHLTVSGSDGSWSLPLQSGHGFLSPDQARWFRRGVVGTIAALGVGVAALGLTLPSEGGGSPVPAREVARPSAPEHTTVVPPVVRTVTVGSRTALPGHAVGGTP
jgi:anti-sigma factor RsiW